MYFEEAGVNKNLNNKMYNRHHAFVCTNNVIKKGVCKGVDIIREEVCLCLETYLWVFDSRVETHIFCRNLFISIYVPIRAHVTCVRV